MLRFDAREFLPVAAEVPIEPEIEEYALRDADRALVDVKEQRVRGAKALRTA